MRISLIASSAALALAACATSSPSSPSSPAPAVVKSTGVPGKAGAERVEKLSATVKAVDRATRSITVQDASGATETFVAPPEMKRFDEIAPGDTIAAEVSQTLLLEYQPPGSETVEPTLVVAAERQPAQAAPGGTATAGVRSTVTITSIDLSSRLVGFQGPNGRSFQVKASPELKIEKLKVGDRLIATYLEATALRLEKTGKR
jgi:hypothetical protein